MNMHGIPLKSDFPIYFVCKFPLHVLIRNFSLAVVKTYKYKIVHRSFANLNYTD